MFSFNDKGGLHQGIAYSSMLEDEWEVLEIDLATVDTDVPFTKHNLAVVSRDDVEQHFMITAGYINNKEIAEIRINYDNNIQKIMKLGDNQTLFIDYEVGNETSVQECNC
ncbi:hypothetical protein [Virgibacillus kimchii]